ncbi:Gfo/Idh/MocA family oxidoreductase [Neobacillus sp. YIM B06451]|uniref:Gfo/Idh/MocA family protein n=1 Tax=Neobacillus sp. YIM B06451 TaxID=3070994 RepID=UPI0029313512|nr:Gfo/Idh/MocA family oxidoreductase [Neobacillus sp. YIM B06451]
MNFAIIGCGYMAKSHAAAIDRIPEAKLAAVCDKDESAMEQYKEYGAKAYTNYNAMLADDEVDAVCICTPASYHTVLVEQAAAAKKHIVLEQPMALALDETERIVEVCRENAVKLTIVHPYRFRPVVKELRKIIDAGMLGKISHASTRINLNRNRDFCAEAMSRGTKLHEAGGLMGQAIDYLDLFLWFLGEPEQVFSIAETGISNIEADAVAAGIIRFESGALGTIEMSTAVYYRNFEESITIFGEKGTVKIGGPNALSFEHFDVQHLSETETERILEIVKSDPWGIPGHEQTISDLIQSVKDNREPLVSGEDGKRALELVLAFYESARNNSPIGMRRGVLL